MQRRPRRTPEQWRVLIADFETSGAAADDFCSQHDLGRNAFDRWRHRFNNPAQPAPALTGFTELVSSPVSTGPYISIHLHDARLELSSNTPIVQIAALMRAVAHA